MQRRALDRREPHKAARLSGISDGATGFTRVAREHFHERSVGADLGAVGQVERVFETGAQMPPKLGRPPVQWPNIVAPDGRDLPRRILER